MGKQRMIILIIVCTCVAEGFLQSTLLLSEVRGDVWILNGQPIEFFFYSPSSETSFTTQNETIDIRWYWWNPSVFSPPNSFSDGHILEFKVTVFTDRNSSGVLEVYYNGTFPNNVSLDQIPTNYMLNFSRFINQRDKTTFGILFNVYYDGEYSGVTSIKTLYKLVWIPKELGRIKWDIPIYVYYLIGIVGSLTIIYAIYWCFYSCSSEESLRTNYCKQKVLRTKTRQERIQQEHQQKSVLTKELFGEVSEK